MLLNRLKRLSVSLLLVFISFQAFMPATVGAASFQSDACSGINALNSDKPSGACDPSSESSLRKLVGVIVSILSIIVGVTAVIMIVIGGFKFITANGESSNVASARSTITYALIGLVVVALAQFIVHFAINTTNGTITPCKTHPSISQNDPRCK